MEWVWCRDWDYGRSYQNLLLSAASFVILTLIGLGARVSAGNGARLISAAPLRAAPFANCTLLPRRPWHCGQEAAVQKQTRWATLEPTEESGVLRQTLECGWKAFQSRK